MNSIQWIGELFHVIAVFIIIGKIIRSKSCEGISGKMQILLAIVYTARYVDLLSPMLISLIVMKVFLIFISYTTIILIYLVYKKTYQREYDAFWIETLIVICLGLGLLETRDITIPDEVLWAFSRYLEAVVVVPQIYFTYKAERKTKIITYYIIALILYRALYIAGWVCRYQFENHFDGYIVYPGIVQFVIYFTYFFLPKEPTTVLPTTIVDPVVTPSSPGTPISHRTPKFLRQESLLETPFLKRNAASYTSVYAIGLDSKTTSPNGSVKSLNLSNKQEDESTLTKTGIMCI